MVQVLCDCDAREGRKQRSTMTSPGSAGGTRRIRSSASSPRATSSSPAGKELDEVCRHLEIAESTWHRWLAQYGGMKANDAKRLKELEAENARLKKLVAEPGARQVDAQGARRGKLLTPNRKRSAVGMLRDRFGVSERRACRVVGQHRSTQRLDPPPVTDDEAELRAFLRQLRQGPSTVGVASRRQGGPPSRAARSTTSGSGVCGVTKDSASRRSGARSASPVSARTSGRCARSARTRCGRWTSSSTPPSTGARSRCST